MEPSTMRIPAAGETETGAPDDVLASEIRKLKKEKNAVILAHYYQLPAIQDIADYVGDSLGLSQKAAATGADVIVFAGVHFMAETAKILNPAKKVLIPDVEAGCSLEESCPPALFREFIRAHPGHVVISYINCSAEIKALSDIICTSSNALQVINSVPKNTPLIFAPDKNLGRFLERASGRKMVLWEGECIVHQEFSASRIGEMRGKYPGIKVIAHPECSSYLLDQADFIGSTSALLNYAKADPAPYYLVATETGLLYQMQKANPEKKFIPAPVVTTCVACQECPYMKVNTLEKVYRCLKNGYPEITVPEDIRIKAFRAVKRMLEISPN